MFREDKPMHAIIECMSAQLGIILKKVSENNVIFYPAKSSLNNNAAYTANKYNADVCT